MGRILCDADRRLLIITFSVKERPLFQFLAKNLKSKAVIGDFALHDIDEGRRHFVPTDPTVLFDTDTATVLGARIFDLDNESELVVVHVTPLLETLGNRLDTATQLLGLTVTHLVRADDVFGSAHDVLTGFNSSLQIRDIRGRGRRDEAWRWNKESLNDRTTYLLSHEFFGLPLEVLHGSLIRVRLLGETTLGNGAHPARTKVGDPWRDPLSILP